MCHLPRFISRFVSQRDSGSVFTWTGSVLFVVQFSQSSRWTWFSQASTIFGLLLLVHSAVLGAHCLWHHSSNMICCGQQNDDRGSKFLSTSTTDSSSCLPLSLPPLHVAPPRTTAYCHCACAELQNTMTDATPTASNASHITNDNQ
jgi:hypothetical protein